MPLRTVVPSNVQQQQSVKLSRSVLRGATLADKIRIALSMKSLMFDFKLMSSLTIVVVPLHAVQAVAAVAENSTGVQQEAAEGKAGRGPQLTSHTFCQL